MVAVGAVVLPGAVLRTGSIAAAGAVLAQSLEVPSGHRAQGVPARVVASAHPDREYVGRGAANYVAMAERFARAGIGSTGATLAREASPAPTDTRALDACALDARALDSAGANPRLCLRPSACLLAWERKARSGCQGCQTSG